MESRKRVRVVRERERERRKQRWTYARHRIQRTKKENLERKPMHATGYKEQRKKTVSP